MGFPWARYYDLAHGNPISHTHIERDFGGGSEGRSPSMHAPPRAVRNRAAAVSEGCRGVPCHVLSVAKV